MNTVEDVIEATTALGAGVGGRGRAELLHACARAGLQHRYVEDSLCRRLWTVRAWVRHSALVEHGPDDACAYDEVDERDAGRQGESRTAVRS